MSRFVNTLALLCASTVQIALAEAAELDGELVYNNHCRKCHSMKKDDHRLGPSLYGIVGKKAEQAQEFGNYSGALGGIIWDEATLDKFIADPTTVSSSTNMIYPPVKNPAERTAIIEFMKKSAGQ